MKNIISVALVAAMALSLAACDPAHKPSDSTSTTTTVDSMSTKTVSNVDSTGHDSSKLAAQTTAGKKAADGSASLQAVKDSLKKDSAKIAKH